jgi:hypothetical protein
MENTGCLEEVSPVNGVLGELLFRDSETAGYLQREKTLESPLGLEPGSVGSLATAGHAVKERITGVIYVGRELSSESPGG